MSRAEDMAPRRIASRGATMACGLKTSELKGSRAVSPRTLPRTLGSLAGLLLTCSSYQAMMVATAWADDPCSSAAGVTTCSGNQVDGAASLGTDATLIVNNLTNPTIAPPGGVAGAATVFAPGAASNGSDSFAGIPNSDADNGGSTPNVSVTVTSPGAGFQITTSGYGIVAQSRGQSGGTGGDGYGATIPVPFPPFLIPAPGIAGDGGHGGNGGDVSVTTQGPGQITTSGDNNHGILALSSGGSGGNGGDAFTFLGLYGSGGNGGAGGAPGTVTVNNSFNIATSGTGAAGIWAQSVGGSGGNGGTSEGSAINDGGNGAAASDGGTVHVTSSGIIGTTGNGGVGIFAQSVGGFAGSGGGAFGIGLSFGGSSASAGAGGNVTVDVGAGRITTSGQGAAGLVAQSVGGGGGYGGAGGALVGFGGDASTGGKGGVVDVTNHSDIATQGGTSSAIYAQSVGGSGGNGAPSGGLFALGGNGGAGGAGDSVTVRNFGVLSVGAGDSYGIFAQSVGGGGGDGGASGGLVSIGGSGTVGGNGGDVRVENAGDITASCVACSGSGAIFAQSVGGGGGNGGVSGGLVSIGGSGDKGANGQSVTVQSLGATLTTHGTQSDGIFAQSVGGGGGKGGVSGGLVAIGGTGAGGGTGGAVLVTTSGHIITTGDDSAGLYAQSVGGGGGRGGTTGGLVSVGGSGGGGGAAGTVTVSNSARIETSGVGSEAIFAQSIGGGGGDGGFAGGWFSFGGGGADDQGGGKGELVTVTNSGSLSTTGTNAAALFAQSVGGGGGSGGGAVGIGAFASLALGGNGGKGGEGGDVKVNEFTTDATPGYAITTQGDNSAGVFAQSIGGGGGAGGFALAASGGLYGSVSAAFGGSGGGGGKAGTVIVGNSGTIETFGNFSSGISAQSTGGGGGSGGFAISAAVSTGAAASLSFGGSGASGGDGGDVTVHSYTDITTHGAQSYGILAHSVGGGGGNGGFAVSVSGSPYGSLALGFGGKGDGGGNGGAVTVNSVGNITTSGDLAHGILAESIGGGGGSGGFSVAGAVTVSGNAVSAALSFGGKGGGGGDGRKVDVTSDGDIHVSGAGAVGILAQSVGGGGGNGGFSGAISVSAGNTYGNSVGGAGGTASKGGEVVVTSQGHITTDGNNGTGILAQSIGGGGGNGGFSLTGTVSLQGESLGESVGGSGGAGGAADNVTVHHTGSITTHGDMAAGILAQSVRGGGGNGGFSAGVGVSLKGGAKMSSVGGSGGAADTSDNLTLVHVIAEGGTIETQGALSHGIQAQSVGGGGGNGGFAIGGTFSLKADSKAEVGGGAGGSGGNGGAVLVDSSEQIITHGDSAIGIFAQSVGGGGGSGGFSLAAGLSAQGSAVANSVGGAGGVAGKGGVVTVNNLAGGNILTYGAMAHGIEAQSVGGGGGNGGFAIGGAFSLDGKASSEVGGGAGGAGGDAAKVTVSNAGIIETRGDSADGILAQSVGGGGGNGGFAISLAGSAKADAVSSSVGGAGGGASKGGDVEVTNTSSGQITTSGAMAHGIQAQSIGGGGGNGAFAIGAGLSLQGKAESKVGGGTGGAGGNAGKVTVSNAGVIQTQGASAIGIFAQSVGGGGGNGGFAISFAGSAQADAVSNSVGGAGGTASTGGDVEVKNTSSGQITTSGAMAHGIQAQSIGGGGGNGGFAIGAGLALKGEADSKVGGGAGGAGGSAGTVTVTNDGAIVTQGAGSIGIFAQAVGGGGGSGGFSLSGALGTSAVSNAVGGSGGAASDGGVVSVTNTGLIYTGAANSIGILAQSVGGGGGNGAFSLSAGISTSSGGNSSSVGGDGTAGGNGKSVTVDNSGLIITTKDLSTGILAQSIGGGGGNGGVSVAGSLNSGGNSTSSVGGQGGGGGNGGDVRVTNTGTIVAQGANSFGIFAQSVGGGGGSGGFSGGLAVGGGVSNVVGGAGGKGGDGGDVTVISSGNIYTTADNSSAVFAQSVAGSGGWGGLSIGLGSGGGSTGLSIGLGATGNILDGLPVDGKKGVVTVTITGDTTETAGALSYGLLAQSVGGGGGAAGSVLRGLLGFIGSDVDLQVGSNGSMNGSGTFQSSSYANDTTTTGLGSIGLISQSIGGGGGVSGLVVDAVSLNPLGNDSFHINVGGFSGGVGLSGGGSGGGFNLTAQGTVTTTNANAIGVLAQTIGGGGGVGNVTIGSVTNTGDTLAVVVGGSQLTAGNAGAASQVTAEQTISTSGVLSHGLVAQSIGGGGGVADLVFQNGVTFTNGVAVTLGSGAGGAGGNGGDVVATAAAVETTGAGAFGIVAQSIGGGGGLTGIASGNTVLGQAGFSLSPVTIAGGNGAGGNGGAATVVANGTIITTGYGAHGIVAQSIGGGGGIVGAGAFATTLGGSGAFAGSVGGVGTAGTVNVSTFGNVMVGGDTAVGIFAQSAGGSGNGDVHVAISHAGNGVGLIWAPAGTGAAVEVADGAANTVRTDGTLYAQNGLYGSGVAPALNGLAIRGGSGAEAVTNLAYTFPAVPDPSTGYGYGADYGVVFNLTSGATDPNTGDPIYDTGTRTSNVIGNVNLGAGNNSFSNEAGALFITADTVRLDDAGAPVPLGTGQQLTNAGLLSPGDRGRLQTTDIYGNFVQTATGTTFIDVDLNTQQTDRLNVTGGAEVGGKGGLLLLSINKKFDEYVIVHADQGVTDTGFDPTIVPPGVGFDFNTKVENGGQDLVLYADKPAFTSLLFGSGVFDPNVVRMAGGLDNIEASLGVNAPFNYLINLLRLQPDREALGQALVTLTPSQAPHLFELTFRQTMNFMDQVTDCPLNMGQGWFSENSCLWVRASYGEYERESVADGPQNRDNWSAFTIGGQFEVAPKWQLGFGFNMSQVNSTQTIGNNSYLSSLEGDVYQLGLSATYRETNGLGVGLLVTGSRGAWDAQRQVDVGGYKQTYTSFDGVMSDSNGVAMPGFSEKEIVFRGIAGLAKSSPDVDGFSSRLRFSYLDTLGDVRVMPFFDIDGYWIRTAARTETGVSLANLVYPAVTQTAVTFTPGIQLDGRSQLTEELALRAFIRGSVMLSPDDQWEAQTQFAYAPPGLPPIKIIDSFDPVVAKLDTGVMLTTAGGQELQLNYGVAIGDTTFQYQVRGGFSQRF